MYSTIFYDKLNRSKFIVFHGEVCQAELSEFIKNKFNLSSFEYFNRFTHQFIGDKTDFSLGYKKYKNYKETEMLYYTKD